jgi:hypothetical protein
VGLPSCRHGSASPGTHLGKVVSSPRPVAIHPSYVIEHCYRKVCSFKELPGGRACFITSRISRNIVIARASARAVPSIPSRGGAPAGVPARCSVASASVWCAIRHRNANRRHRPVDSHPRPEPCQSCVVRGSVGGPRWSTTGGAWERRCLLARAALPVASSSCQGRDPSRLVAGWIPACVFVRRVSSSSRAGRT